MTEVKSHRFKEIQTHQENAICGPCLDTDLNKLTVRYKIFWSIWKIWTLTDETFDDCKELPFLRLDNGMVNIF